jgi:hypothetical protein
MVEQVLVVALRANPLQLKLIVGALAETVERCRHCLSENKNGYRGVFGPRQ